MSQTLRERIYQVLPNDVSCPELVDAIEALIGREKAASYLEGMKDAEALFTE